MKMESSETDPSGSAAGTFQAVACRKYNITYIRPLHPQTRAGNNTARFSKDDSGTAPFSTL
jgi:hypothetical protein